jgi:hypothetical protein
MSRNEANLSIDPPTVDQELVPPTIVGALEWDWDLEHADRKLEAKSDAAMHGATPFQVDRKLLKDIVREKTCVEVARITFLSSGAFWGQYCL